MALALVTPVPSPSPPSVLPMPERRPPREHRRGDRHLEAPRRSQRAALEQLRLPGRPATRSGVPKRPSIMRRLAAADTNERTYRTRRSCARRDVAAGDADPTLTCAEGFAQGVKVPQLIPILGHGQHESSGHLVDD